MVWIRVDTALTRHPKVIKFASAINASRHEAIGLLVDLWTWSIDYAEDGDLTKYTSAELLTALGAFQTSALIEIDLLEALNGKPVEIDKRNTGDVKRTQQRTLR